MTELGIIPSLIIGILGMSFFWAIQTYSEMKKNDDQYNAHLNLMKGTEWMERAIPLPTNKVLVKKNTSGVSGMKIISQYVQDENVLRKLSSHELWQQCSDEEQHWMDVNASPKNILEQLAQQIWSSHELYDDDVAGYEYWCNILGSESTFGWHVDKSEKRMHEQHILHTPLMGAVYYGYPHSNFYGGYLEIMQAHPYDEITPFYANAEIERIKPEYNRLVYLNVTEWHRVSEIRGEGKRYTLAVNLWKDKPMDFE